MKKLFLFLLIILLLSSAAIAANERNYVNGPVNQTINTCVTDDAGLEWRLLRCDSNGYQKVTLGTALSSSSDSIALDTASNAAVNITTNTTTVINSTNGAVNRIFVNTAGSGSTAAFYDIAEAGCTGTPASGYLFTVATASTSNATTSMINHIFANGICVVTAGTAAANISVLYKDLP